MARISVVGVGNRPDTVKLPIRLRTLLASVCGPRVGDSLNQSSWNRSSVFRFQPNRLSEIHEGLVSTYCVARRFDPFSKIWSLPMAGWGFWAYGLMREAVTDSLPLPVSRSTLVSHVLSRRIRRLASVYRPMTSLIG